MLVAVHIPSNSTASRRFVQFRQKFNLTKLFMYQCLQIKRFIVQHPMMQDGKDGKLGFVCVVCNVHLFV